MGRSSVDILRDSGAVFLGSRLKRLGERMQAGAARIIAEAGLPTQPAHMPLLAALDVRPMTIGQLVQAVGVSQPGVTRSVSQLIALGLAHTEQGADLRQRTVSLTPAGAAAMARVKLHVVPQIEAAVDALCRGQTAAFLSELADMEAVLLEKPLDQLAVTAKTELFTLHDYRDDLASHFHDINVEWIEGMFSLEATDREVLENPRAKIIDGGGIILFVEARGLGIIGACALQKTGAHSFELTKMGVRETARGLKAGEFLLTAMIERAKGLGANPLYLMTNKKCEAAIHLYETNGFEHDAEIMAQYGARYARCDVAMRYQSGGG